MWLLIFINLIASLLCTIPINITDIVTHCEFLYTFTVEVELIIQVHLLAQLSQQQSLTLLLRLPISELIVVCSLAVCITVS